MPRKLKPGAGRLDRTGGSAPPDGARQRRPRRLQVEPLEGRNLLAALPFGAMPDDTGEYMLGDVHVTVVLMESNNAIDNGTINYVDTDPNTGGNQSAQINYTPENWTTDTIGAVKANVLTGLNWWKDTLDALPTVRDGLLNFTVDWTYADTPVATGYEPIARISNDFSLWIYDFLNKVGFTQTGNFSSDIRAYNNSRREATGSDWAFTIFVVNNAADSDKFFTQIINGSGTTFGSFGQAFSFAGGRFMIVPASRPASTFAHETGHMFWAFDEYDGSSAGYLSRRGYYNTQNYNHINNPTPGFVHASSIMSNGASLDAAYAGHTSSTSSLETIGWRDTDNDGIFDVLDVPFKLSGIGRYTAGTGLYRFTGSASVATLPNQNTSGLQNDITINQLRVVEVSIDNGPWTTVQTLPPRTYQTAIDVSFAVPGGPHTVKLRVADTRTGVTSQVFTGDTGAPSQTGSPGIGGFVFRDDDGDGAWDANEPPLVDFGLDVVDQGDTPIDLRRNIEPSAFAESTVLNNIHPEARLSAVGGDVIATNEIQRLSITGPAGGSVTPAFEGVNGLPLVITSGLPLTAAQVQASLNAIPALAGKITVSGASGGPFDVTFTGPLAQTNVSLITQGAASGGAALGTEVLVDGVPAQIIARTSGLFSSSAGKVFTTRSVSLGQLSEKWNSSRQLKVSFNGPVGVVSIRAFGAPVVAGQSSFARLEAYNSQGVLLERFTSGAISGTVPALLSISRSASDIAYIIVRGHAGTEVVLDTLQWGPTTSATSNNLGAYSLAFLPPGTYRVKADPPPNHTVTTPVGGVATITVAPGQSAAVNFGIHIQASQWHNLNKPLNVDNDVANVISPLDALLVINWLNAHPNQSQLPSPASPAVDGYIDVNNDGLCTPLDALIVINELNMGSGGSGGSEGEGLMPRTAGSDSPRAEGETSPAAPLSAEEYYARKPIHFLEIAGTDIPCTCEQCLAQRAGQAIGTPAMMPARPAVTVIDTTETNTPAASPSKARIGRTTEGTQLPRVQQNLLPAKKVVSPLAARKNQLEQTISTIAADVSQAHADAPARLVQRRGRGRSS